MQQRALSPDTEGRPGLAVSELVGTAMRSRSLSSTQLFDGVDLTVVDRA
jgi:hypothetical protein